MIPEMTVAEFLEARIAEDEAAVERRGYGAHFIRATDAYGTFNQRCPDCLGLPARERTLAECAAKRALVGFYKNGAIGEMYDGEKWTSQLAAFAAVYKDHPDYQQEWAL